MPRVAPAGLLARQNDPVCYATGRKSGFLEFQFGSQNRMSTLVKVQPKGQMTIPRRVRSAVGLIDGDLVDVRAVGKRIVITPQLAVNRSESPAADDQYTPEQRRSIGARLDVAEKGPFYGPFKNGTEVAAFLKEKGAATARPAKSRKLR
jgi:AbrB family looped-hinge helix DNA binding protein